MKICHVEDMRNLDRRAVDEYQIIEELLMENAGLASFFTILNNLGILNKHFVVFCGVGNNGGDGLVVARKIVSNGGSVTVFILGDRSKFQGAAKLNFDIALKLKINMIDLEDVVTAKSETLHADAVIDAIFGTGLDREVGGKYKDVIELINSSGKPVFSIDIPSGINGNTGEIMGVAVYANYTTTFGLPKIGNLLYPGFEMGGKLYVTHISFPPALYNSIHLKIATNDPVPLPQRDADSHKGSYGKVLFIAGSSNYLGAPYFAAHSFLKAGGGLSFLATPTTVSPFIGNKGSEIIFVPQQSTATGSIDYKNKQQLLDFAENVDLVVMGPGLSLHDDTKKLVKEFARELPKPLLIDGDGITAITENLETIRSRKQETILTPHLGEMARLTNQTIENISKNKINVLQQTAQHLKSIIVLKGAHSLIGYPDGRVFVNLSGNPGMATAGSGDVLTGAIAAMHGLGLPIEDAVRMGVFMHGFAGDLAAKDVGQDGIVASDIMNYLPHAMKMYREQFGTITEDYYHCIHVI